MTTTAIIGLGNIGGRLASGLAAAGSEILLAAPQLADAERLAATLGAHTRPVAVEEAVEEADILIFAVWLDALRDLIEQYRDRLPGKIIVDPSNPIAPDGNGGFVKTIPAEQSSGEVIAALLPPNAALVKAFGTLAADSLTTAAHRNPPAVGFYATDDEAAGEVVAVLIRAAGFDPMRVGGISSAARIEVFGDLHEFGGLGHPVTRAEAEAALTQN
ncbi:NADPH-dependent F420 reductase [Nocardia sp. NBC_00511]|uniref:NADPH-dependent F420 reductase n=1 Tax=Nocardia sp. NBC_00511 TaxID=2903591 RepID=UPI0030E574E3